MLQFKHTLVADRQTEAAIDSFLGCLLTELQLMLLTVIAIGNDLV